MLKIIVHSSNSDLEGAHHLAPTWPPLPAAEKHSDPKHTDFSNNKLLFFIDTISQSYPEQWDKMFKISEKSSRPRA